ncbi:hypothetical protein J4573_00505 [Actinomadura barringtoniae]|uniref:Uncharacterized protein n=1 Tax=Actinomadura barringtoniae TaxID=1427535 RepID=A0A939P5V2_9ACTN|nr:hypothetical protein [Actinomadura barringtoniae]MBO2445560.1 hypothetical protein [Actinomadura barringtoniae]
MIGKTPLPKLDEQGDLVLPSVHDDPVVIDFCRAGGLGLTGIGAVYAMYGMLSGLISTRSNPDVILTGSDEDFTFITGLEVVRHHVPAKPELMTLPTSAKVMELVRLELARRRADEADGSEPWLILLATSNAEVRAGLEALPRDSHLDRFGAILVGPCPTGLTCVIDSGGRVGSVLGDRPEEWFTATRDRLGKAVFAQGEIDRSARDFLTYMARAAWGPDAS